MSSQYAPNGEIYFGSVPWSNDYAHVRHYTSLSSQYTDIHGLMFNHTSDYTYIDKNRRLKVQLNSDQLRHVNYCMFKNNSSTNRWIYCFVSDITYVNGSYGDIQNFNEVQDFFHHITQAGAIDAISAVFTVPDFAIDPNYTGFSTTVTSAPRNISTYQAEFRSPYWGSMVGNYTPHNRKLLYYPYTFARLTDFNGNVAELRYELAKLEGSSNDQIGFAIKYEATGTCQALVYPKQYMGVNWNLDNGIVTNCGAPCSWSNDQFTSWLAQNSGAIVAGVLTDTAAMATGLKGISTATKALRGAEKLTQAKHLSAGGKRYANFLADKAEGSLSSAKGKTGGAALGAGADLLDIYDQSKKPALNRGASSYDLMAMSGMQGVRCLRIQVKEEIARNIDKFFDTWGYTIEQVKEINVTSRKSWNYVKTSGSMPRSVTGGVSSGSKVFSGGQGTPADALATIKSQFDAGITFWHTTNGFGNYLLDNTL